MRSFILAFLCGILFLQQFSHLPPKYWILILLSINIPLFFIKPFRKYIRLILSFILGFIWCLWYAHHQLSHRLPKDFENQPIAVTGYIASIPVTNSKNTTFLFSAREIQHKKTHSLLKLSWQTQQHLIAGSQWRFTVRLKKPYGNMNPGGFDEESWAFQEGIQASGYVMSHADNKSLGSHSNLYFLTRIRQSLQESIAKNLPKTTTSHWIMALTIGERVDIPAEDWEVLRNTGTNHLMVIAGLHIGFMAALAHFVIKYIWRRIPKFTLAFPAAHAGAIAALLIAFIYSAMAGFSLPTQRALIMLSTFLSTTLLRRQVMAWHGWCLALLCVLCLNPTSVLSDSFWLSFGSVALIIYGVSGRLAPKGLWWQWGRIQWVVALGLVPLSIGLFQQFSFISFFANSITIPLVGFIIVPLCLLGCFFLLFSGTVGGSILILADKLLSLVWLILTWFAYLPHMVWHHVILYSWILIVAVIGVCLLLLPVGFPGRYLGVLWLLPLYFVKAPKPEIGDVWLTLLDVGQGLSAVVQTHQHVLVYDTGARVNHVDMGESVVLPFLRSVGVDKLDKLVISHEDNDHSGGAKAILTALPVKNIVTSAPKLFPDYSVSYCLEGMSWEWDGIQFEFLYPTVDKLNQDNNSSCVLRIRGKHNNILLTGDIEKLAEKELLIKMPHSLTADILIAPHHGSKTSAIPGFIEAINPHYVLFPVGYLNRYHLPNVTVLQQYQNLHIVQYDTVTSGAIQFKLTGGNNLSEPSQFRTEHHRYWNV